ncbi:hypothetical protein EON65_44655, partial [archaeon]
MVKLLFIGSVNGEWDIFFQKLKEVQSSAHGPFDVLFVVGKAFSTDEEFQTVLPRLRDLPELKIYFLQYPPSLYIDNDDSNVAFLGPDKVGLINAHKNLTIAYAFGLTDQTYHSYMDTIRRSTSNMAYRGCDALLTSSWPADAYQFLEGADMQDYTASGIGIGAGSRYVSELALLTRPRYHFVADAGQFYQRLPYKNVANSAGQCAVYTRLISLHYTTPSKDKSLKWMHALNIQPIIYMKTAELEEAPSLFSHCPYVAVGNNIGGGSGVG